MQIPPVLIFVVSFCCIRESVKILAEYERAYLSHREAAA